MVNDPPEMPARAAELLGPYRARPEASIDFVGSLAVDVLAEIGRIALSAIELEDVVYSVCRSIKPRHGPFDDWPIGKRIAEALEDLAAECPEGPDRSRAESWLGVAKEALAERNSVLHSVPVVGFGPAAGSTALVHSPKDKSRPTVRTTLSVEFLEPITARMKAARNGWVEVALVAYPSHPTHGGKASLPPKEWL